MKMDLEKRRKGTFSLKLRCNEELLNVNTLNNGNRAAGSLHKLSFKYKFCSRKNDNKCQGDLPVNYGLGPGLRLPPFLAVGNSRILLRLQWELFYCVWFEIWKSKRFRMSFICWLLDSIEGSTLNEFCSRHNYVTRERTGDAVTVYSSCMQELVHLNLEKNEESRPTKSEIAIDVCILLPLRIISINKDLFWACLLLPLIHQKISLEYILACLSTLGGAYSSLGEHSISHAKVAGDISKKQLAIALKMNNLLLMSHCRLYYAHSLMQIGKFRLASTIIRQEYTIANSDRGISDPKLISCCRAAWIKLKYLRKRHKEEHNVC